MKTDKNKPAPKGCAVAVGIVIVVLAVFLAIKVVVWAKSEPKTVKTDFSQEWAVMTYEEREIFLSKAISEKTLTNASEIEHAMRKAIKEEVKNPKTLSFVWSPSVEIGIIVEADSGWISVPFKCYAQNDLGVEKEIMGTVVYMYVPETHSLGVKRWDINQNN